MARSSHPVAAALAALALIAAAPPDFDPKPFKAPRQPRQPQARQASSASVIYANCTEARAAGAAPLRRGDPGYAAKLDRDNDGIACE